MLSCSLAKSSGISLKRGSSVRFGRRETLSRHVKSQKALTNLAAHRVASPASRSTSFLNSRFYSTNKDHEDMTELLKKTIASVESLESELNGKGVPEVEFEIDRSGLHPFGLKKKDSLSWEELEQTKGKRSEMIKQLVAIIQTRGPMSVASFMNYALTHPVHGYYMKSDVFGKAGDFTTSPEISQMFGELLGVWCAAMWEHLGRPEKLHIVEIGPGRGTLSSDMLNATKNMRSFFKSVHLHLVEVSPHLRRLQAQKFGLVYPATLNPDTIASIPVPEGLDMHVHQPIPESTSGATQYTVNRPTDSSSSTSGTSSSSSGPSHSSDLLPDVTLKTLPGTPISWHIQFEDIPEYPGEPVLVIAQEFFDALPVYQLEMTKNGWRERLVDFDDRPDSPDWFRTTLAPTLTPACMLIEEADEAHHGATKIGMGIEKCADGLAVCQSISDRLAKHGGAAIFIDYGYEFTHGWSIRGIQNHEFVSIYREPGDVDLSTNVDFAALTRAALTPKAERKTNDLLHKLRVYGSVNQGDFLASLGIHSRMAKLLRKATTEEDAESLIAAYTRLTDKRQMGTNYKVLGIFSDPNLVPEGFEGIDFKSTEDFLTKTDSNGSTGQL